MIEQRDQLAEKIQEMQRTLERLNTKIDRYEQVLLPREKRLRSLHGRRDGTGE